MNIQPLRTFAILALIGSLAARSPADTYPRQAGVDVIHYIFALTLGDNSDVIEGETQIRLRFATDGVKQVSFDLINRAFDKGMTVAGVSMGDKALAFAHTADRLTVTLPEPSTAAREAALTIRYSGVPGAGLRIGPNRHGDRVFFSENWPNNARQWLPMIDHPYDKATGEFIVTAPAQYQVVANGLLVEELDLPGGGRRTHWRQSVPIASWLYALGVARFAVHHAGLVKGVELSSYVFPQNRDEVTPAFETTGREALSFFHENIGPFPYEKLANVQAMGFAGGTEHASAIFYGENSVTGRPIVGLVTHEIAHQWFGDSITERDWDDAWLSEGFATYFTLLFTEHAQGRDAFVTGLKSSRSRVLELEQKLPDTPVIHRNLSDMKKVLNQLIYQKGGWTLHMLRAQIGAPAFWTGIRDYYRRYRDGSATTDEFRRVMEQVSGQDLDWFFKQWLTRSGVPKIEGGWRYDAALKQVEVTLNQTQTGDLYRLPIEVGWTLKAGEAMKVEKAMLSERTARFTFAAEAEPASVTIDPDTWLLMEAGPLVKGR